MAKALAYGLGWVALAGVVGALVGAVATGIPGIILWSLSGIAVGTVQWAFVRRQLQVSVVSWIAATAIGAFVTIALHFFWAS